MEEKKNLLTYAGLKALEDELHDLKVNRRKEVAGKIKEAREQGDLSENAEYDAAKDEQRDIEARIEEIEKILKNAEVVVEDVEELINEKTVALLYVKSHHCVQKGMLDLPTMIDIAHRHNLPLMVDAAAEEDFRKYIAMGADLVCYSGAKALEATTSGFVTGKKELISYIKKQYHGVGRAMKVGKEAIMGLLAALEQYENKDKQAEVAKNVKIVDWLVDEINQIPNLKAQKIQDEAGRAIFRARVFVDPEKAGMTATELEGKLKAGTPTIRCRTEFMSLGSLDFDPRPLVEGDKELIVAKLKEIMEA